MWAEISPKKRAPTAKSLRGVPKLALRALCSSAAKKGVLRDDGKAVTTTQSKSGLGARASFTVNAAFCVRNLKLISGRRRLHTEERCAGKEPVLVEKDQGSYWSRLLRFAETPPKDDKGSLLLRFCTNNLLYIYVVLAIRTAETRKAFSWHRLGLTCKTVLSQGVQSRSRKGRFQRIGRRYSRISLGKLLPLSKSFLISMAARFQS